MVQLLPRAVLNWHRIVRLSSPSLLIKTSIESVRQRHSWGSAIKDILSDAGMMYIWNNANTISSGQIRKVITANLQHRYAKQWSENIFNPDAKLRTYHGFKKTYSVENYLLCLNFSKRTLFTRLRLSSHRLEIELGRHSKPKTNKEDRKCKDCSLDCVGDEFHAIMICPKYSVDRSKVFLALDSYTSFYTLTSIEQFNFIMSYNNGDTEVLKTIFPLVENIMC